MSRVAQVLFTRAPLPGKTKRRLTPFLTSQQASDLHKAMISDTVSVMKRVEADIFICHEPSCDDNFSFEEWVGKQRTYPQRGRVLHQKVINGFMDVSKRGYQKAFLIVSDSPLIQEDYLQQALDAVNNDEPVAVIGPSHDRGAYLLGVNRFEDFGFLKDIPWSESTVLDILISRISASGFSLITLPAVRDIDEKEDVYWLLRESARVAGHELQQVKKFFRAEGKSIFNGT
ncbi:MAG: TIGR04282 family arsenosugar biosynthesis glycosyltransferase [Candidatus Omnitrophica bacterium]|nr:TIGR04282 family arsenosugar biosynthesis glycosyltransferase [Candidatus Omnitrophota bacterium]